MTIARPRLLRWTAAAAIAVVLAVGLWAFVSLSVDQPVAYESILEHFKYGSIGSEPGGSLLQPVGGVLPPYWVFRALPSICSDKLPGGYASFGFIIEPGKDLPVGVSRRRRLGIDQVGLNCAVCHTGTVRDAPNRAARESCSACRRTSSICRRSWSSSSTARSTTG